ncbi:MAG: ModD protein, partial [Sutterella sp.]|nr:ModD protein [Sutterella sp.]
MLTTRQWAESILLADCPYEDLTTVGLGIEETCGTVSASLKTPGIAAGIDLAREIFLAAGASVEVFAKDGDLLAARVPFLCARGSAQALHAAYKTAQCVMEYAGGIAERTRAMVDAARSVNPQAVVAGTRKHYPGGKR